MTTCELCTGQLTLAGVDDPAVDADHQRKETELRQPSREPLVILLKHQPCITASARERVDVQLAGHIHGRQISPFNLFTWLSYHVSTGLTPFGERLRLYVSRGTAWGSANPFFCRSGNYVDCAATATITARPRSVDGARW